MNDNERIPTGTANHAPGRDQTGRFAKGNACGLGNPFARKVAELRSALVNSISVDDIKQMVRVMVDKARSGDVAAAKLLFQYALGKPGAAGDPDRVDVDGWKLLMAKSCRPQEMSSVMAGIPVDLATTLTGLAWPGVVEANLGEPLRKGIAKMDRRDQKAANRKKPVPSEDCFSTTAVERMVFGDGIGTAPSTNGDNGEAQRGRR